MCACNNFGNCIVGFGFLQQLLLFFSAAWKRPCTDAIQMYNLLVGEPHFVEWNSVSTAFGGDIAVAAAATATVVHIVFLSHFLCLFVFDKVEER